MNSWALARNSSNPPDGSHTEITGSGVFGWTVLSSGKRPFARYWLRSEAPGPFDCASAPAVPFERTTIAWCSGTTTLEPTLPSSRNPSVAPCLMMLNRGRTRPCAGYVVFNALTNPSTCPLALAGCHFESLTTWRSLKNITSTMSFAVIEPMNAFATVLASSKRLPIVPDASMRMSHAVPTPGCARLSPHRALGATNEAGRSSPSTVTVKIAAVSGNGAMGE
jgi:hypothetical protein